MSLPAVDSWREWKNRCAIGLCSGTVQNELRNFAEIRFKRYLRRYAFRANLSVDHIALTHDDASHLFETYLAVRKTRRGKKYKEWLFARTMHHRQIDPKALAGGASLLIRDVAREHLRKEYAPSEMISLNSPIGSLEGTSLTLEDLLPGTIDPLDEVAKREFEQLAAKHAQEIFATMNRREKIAVLAKALEMSLANGEVEQAAGCRKSVLNQSYRNFILNTVSRMKKVYSTEDSNVVKVLTLTTLEAINEVVRTWAGSSVAISRCFSTGKTP